MIVNVYCPSKDKHFRLDVGQELTLNDFKALCSVECGVDVAHMNIFLNSRQLSEPNNTLQSYNVVENDMFLLQVGIMPSLPRTGTSSIPAIDFSNVRVPGRASTSRPTRIPPTPNPAQPNMNDPAALRDWFLKNPHDLALLKERNPALAEPLLSGDLQKLSIEIQKIKDAKAKEEREKIKMLNADPMDLEVQKKIAEEIQRKNIDENMTMAIEEAPESFGQVIMLWINLKVNGHHVKAFVDSGAQMTIMSVNCAKRCNIMRLVDRRWEGIAKGVGTQKIIGRIHLAQIQIEDVFLQCSFSVLEDQPMDVLLGLDMLKRHLCVIDLRENALMIGTSNTKTQFLSENQLPSHGRLHDPSSTSNDETQNNEDAEINKALLESAAEAMKREEKEQTPSTSPPAAKLPKSSSSPPIAADNVQQLVTMGFPRAAAEEELRVMNGDLQRAIVSLLMKNIKE